MKGDFGSYSKGVDAGLIVIDNKEFGDQVVVLEFSGERKALRTQREIRALRVAFHRSMWLVLPLSLPTCWWLPLLSRMR
jgi:hypothetical protein